MGEAVACLRRGFYILFFYIYIRGGFLAIACTLRSQAWRPRAQAFMGGYWACVSFELTNSVGNR